uniref:Uncharacterized protein n=1 Tax=Anguilla anguilla TaxID=7936 RepID=A0A0E9VYZ6_ANGAN
MLAGAPLEPPATPVVTPTAAPSPSLKWRSRPWLTTSAGTSPPSRPI